MTSTTRVLSSVVPGARGRAGNDPIFALFAEATRRAAAGESILNATLGALITDDGQLGIMPTVLETFARTQSARTAGYAPISGTPAFRSAVIHDLFGDGQLADEAVSVATPGGTGAVYEAVVNFVEPGQSLLTASYYWGPYLEISRHSGRVLDTFPMFDADGGFDVAGLAEALERHAALQGRVLLVLNFPCHNPTGYSLSPDEWKRTAEVVRDVGARIPTTLLLDAAYMRFGGDAETSWIDAMPTMLETATVLVAWTASKSFTQYGARVGALVGLHRDAGEREQIANALGYSCRATWSNGNHLGQAAIAELLTDPEATRRCDAERGELIALLQERVDTFNGAADAAGLHTPRYDSGFFVAVFTPNAQVTAAKMRELGVYVTPIAGAVRAALCSTPATTIPRLVDALAEGVAAAG
jgi:aromatic-amino-acid transaminase